MILSRSALKAGLFAAFLTLIGCGGSGSEDTVTRVATPPLGSFAQIDGKQVHYTDTGRGPAVVLLHGASGNLRDMTFELADRLDDRYRVLAFDRPGLGFSDALNPRGESPQEQARHMAKVLDSLNIRRAIILGHSYGGSVAMAWALERPDQVAGVVSLAGATMPWPGGLGPWYSIAGSRIGGATVVPLLVNSVDVSDADSIGARLFRPNALPSGYIDYVGVDLALNTDSIRQNARQINRLKRNLEVMSEAYPTVTVPVEVLHGSADGTVPAAVHAQPMAQLLPNAELTLLPGIGHMPHHAATDDVVRAVDRVARRAGLR
ncbi:alpha/beta fold hydrolase [Tropicimonas sp. S265A]|uniref:alpha/beta fold hydrolase n=1 Tax=Tropicimonas sp. S265A TaxID=3415134 RepID=UPI003C7D5137